MYVCVYVCMYVKGKGKAVPLQAWSGPEGSRKFHDNGGKVVSLTHRPPLPLGISPGTHSCYRLSRPQGHRMMSMKNSNDTSWDRTSDFPISSTAP